MHIGCGGTGIKSVFSSQRLPTGYRFRNSSTLFLITACSAFRAEYSRDKRSCRLRASLSEAISLQPPDFHSTQHIPLFRVRFLCLSTMGRYRFLDIECSAVMLKREFHGADFSFDCIRLVTSVCRHQHIVQGLQAFLQPFNVLSYVSMHTRTV